MQRHGGHNYIACIHSLSRRRWQAPEYSRSKKASVMHLRLDDEAAGAKVNLLLVLALRRGLGLVLRELATESAGLLGAQVQGLVLLTLVKLAQVRALLEVDHRQDTGNVLANSVAVMLVHHKSHVHASQLAGRTTGHLLDTELKQLLAELLDLVQQVRLGLVLKFVSADLGLSVLAYLSEWQQSSNMIAYVEVRSTCFLRCSAVVHDVP